MTTEQEELIRCDGCFKDVEAEDIQAIPAESEFAYLTLCVKCYTHETKEQANGLPL